MICNRFSRDIGTRFVVIRCMEMKNKTILVVDDEPDIREILVFNLEQEGYRCLQASCGQEGGIACGLCGACGPGATGYYDAGHVRSGGGGRVAEKRERTGTHLSDRSRRRSRCAARVRTGRGRLYPQAFFAKTSIGARGCGHTQAQCCGCVLRTDGKHHSVRRPGAVRVLEDGSPCRCSRVADAYGIRVYSRAEILQYVWPNDGLVLERTVDVTVNRLRKKIGTYREHLKAKTGYGYYWEK